MSATVRFILILVLSAQRTEAFVTSSNSLDCLDSLDCVYAPAQHSVIFPIRESDNGDGISLTELEKGDALSLAFDAMVDSSDFMFPSSAESPSTIIGQGQGHQLSSCRMPAFGTSRDGESAIAVIISNSPPRKV